MQPITNRIIVCEAYHKAVHALTDDGSHRIFTIRTPLFRDPVGATCQANGHIIVGDTNRNTFFIFDAAGRLIRTFNSADAKTVLGGGLDICVLDNRYLSLSSPTPNWMTSMLCVTDLEKINIWSGDGSQRIGGFGLSGRPQGLCQDVAGFLYVSLFEEMVHVYDPRMFRFAPADTFTSEHSSPQLQLQESVLAPLQIIQGTPNFRNPLGLCVDDENTLFVVDQENHRVQIFDYSSS